jgi:hypothetical protein
VTEPTGTLAAWPEARILRAMRAWRRGCVATLPWFRATPFAAANHYRDRSLPVTAPRVAPAAAVGLVRALPAWDRESFWVIDVEAPTALWVASLVRQERGLALALAFNGWYDVDGALDGRAEIPLLLALAERQTRATRGEAGLICEGARATATADAQHLDNRYALSDEELPSGDQLRELGRRRVCVFTAHATAPDLAEWIATLGDGIAVDVVTLLDARAA